MPPRVSADVRDLLRRQRGLIAAWQAPALGIARPALRRAAGTGWMQVTPHVFADREGDLTIAQLRMAGVLECGPASLLAGRSALAEAGWRGQDEGVVEVIAPRGSRHRAGPRPQWLRIHRPDDEVRGWGTPPRVPTARAAVDAAAWARTPREAMFLLTSAAQQRLVTPQQVRRELDGRSRVRNAPVIRDVLDSLVEGVTTIGEAAFLRECRHRGLPRPQMQVARRAGPGRRRVVDAEFRTPGGRLVIVEIDGVGHLEVGTWQDDLTRHNELVAGTGAILLRVSNWQVEHDPDPFFDVLVPLVLSA
jgi:very-short-patch-repair endonuclease